MKHEFGITSLNNPRIYLDCGVIDMAPFILVEGYLVSYLLHEAESFLRY